MFTPQELELLGIGLDAYVDHCEEVEPPEDIKAARDLRTKVDRLQLVDKKVRFTYDDTPMEGLLQEWRELDHGVYALIASRGHMYPVRPGQVHGLAE